MHLVRYLSESGPRAGVLDESGVRPLAPTMAALLALPSADLQALTRGASEPAETPVRLLPPLDGRGEVWCAGVTYARSRSARMEESSEQSVYDRVYSAERPELFLKSPAWRLVTDGERIGIRADSGHDVPEPELAVVANAHGEIVGYTVCDDVSSRSIEGENPLYIPQAKVFAGGCALATGIRPAWEVPHPAALTITASVRRDGADVFAGTTSTDQLVRGLQDLVDVLFTGTGIVPDLEFRLADGDVVTIEIDEIGTLTNTVAIGKEPFRYLAEETAR